MFARFGEKAIAAANAVTDKAKEANLKQKAAGIASSSIAAVSAVSEKAKGGFLEGQRRIVGSPETAEARLLHRQRVTEHAASLDTHLVQKVLPKVFAAYGEVCRLLEEEAQESDDEELKTLVDAYLERKKEIFVALESWKVPGGHSHPNSARGDDSRLSMAKEKLQRIFHPADRVPAQKAERTSVPSGANLLVVSNPGLLGDFYKKELGSHGELCKATCDRTGQLRTVKAVSRRTSNVDVGDEAEILKSLDHPNIIRLHETFQDRGSYYLVMDFCAGGDLFESIIAAGHFNEVQAARVMQQLLLAVKYMHDQFIFFGDMKPENVLLTERNIDEAIVKLVDFSGAQRFTPGVHLTLKRGTPYYVAPQVLEGKYDEKADNWSLGVLMYALLCGYPPFFGNTDAEILARVKVGFFSFNRSDWHLISKDATDLVRELLKRNPADRCTAAEALQHEWMRVRATASVDEQATIMLKNLRGFNAAGRFKKLALQAIARQCDDKLINDMRAVFNKLDTDHDGQLSLEELRTGLEDASLPDLVQDVDHLFADIDVDGSGAIDYSEFLAAAIDLGQCTRADMCWQAFCVFDRDGDERISRSDLELLLNREKATCLPFLSESTIARILDEADQNGDDQVSFDEFMALVQGQSNVVGDSKENRQLDGPMSNSSAEQGQRVPEDPALASEVDGMLEIESMEDSNTMQKSMEHHDSANSTKTDWASASAVRVDAEVCTVSNDPAVDPNVPSIAGDSKDKFQLEGPLPSGCTECETEEKEGDPKSSPEDSTQRSETKDTSGNVGAAETEAVGKQPSKALETSSRFDPAALDETITLFASGAIENSEGLMGSPDPAKTEAMSSVADTGRPVVDGVSTATES